jgi:hypothetical protein
LQARKHLVNGPVLIAFKAQLLANDRHDKRRHINAFLQFQRNSHHLRLFPGGVKALWESLYAFGLFVNMHVRVPVLHLYCEEARSACLSMSGGYLACYMLCTFWNKELCMGFLVRVHRDMLVHIDMLCLVCVCFLNVFLLYVHRDMLCLVCVCMVVQVAFVILSLCS